MITLNIAWLLVALSVAMAVVGVFYVPFWSDKLFFAVLAGLGLTALFIWR